MHPGMAKEGVGASLADPPNLVIPANFLIFTAWGEKKCRNRTRISGQTCKCFREKIWGYLQPDQRSPRLKFFTGVSLECRRNSANYEL
jgi:hypothetical protein